MDLALQAAASENGNDVWATFCAAVTRYGLPAALLSDNGAAFSGKRRGWTSMFEHQLEAVSVYALTSRVSHPQTCGKNERAHQRVQKWLKRRPPARDLADLQELLDTYRDAYNDRGNKVLNKLTPHQRFDLGPLDGPDDLVEPITHVTKSVVSATGSIAVSSVLVGVGRRHAGKSALVFRNGDHATVFIDDLLARQVTIDWTRRYQPQDR